MNKRQWLHWTALAAVGVAASPALASPPIEKGAVVTPVAPSSAVGFEVYLPLRNKAALDRLLKAQQTVGSTQYHVWLTPAQFGAQFGPTAADMANAKAALIAAGLKVSAVHTRSIRVDSDAAHVNGAFHTQLNTIKSPSGVTRTMAMTRPALPSALKATGARILAFNGLPARKPTASKGPLVVTPDNRDSVTGSYWFTDLKQAYGYPSYKTTTAVPGGFSQTKFSDGGGVKVAVLMSDLIYPEDQPAAFAHENFAALAGRPAPIVNTVLVDGGGSYNGNGSFEASLDVQQVTGGAPGSQVTLVSIPDLFDSSIADGYTYIVESNAYDIVNSSFGGCELIYSNSADYGFPDYSYVLDTLDGIFAQGNAQGITFVASSADQGAPMCPPFNYFYGESGSFINGVSSPADDPNVTAVGGGNLITTHGPGLNSAYVRESAYADTKAPYDPYGTGGVLDNAFWAAGGGISVYYAKPSYQGLVGTGSAGTGSDSFRTVPDVGMQVGGLGFSTNGSSCDGVTCSIDDSSVRTAFGVAHGGGFYRTIGTSVSSPEFVGALALYEQRAHRQGNVNGFLYAAAAAQIANPALHYYRQNIPGYDGAYAGGFPNSHYDYIYGNGSPNVVNLFGLNAYGKAGVPQTPSNP